MVSSSPMKVAQFPSEQHHKDSISMPEMPNGKSMSSHTIQNGYVGLPGDDPESKPLMNGFSQSSDVYSEPSTNGSVDDSPESSEDQKIAYSPEDKFVDAPQTTPDVANLNGYNTLPQAKQATPDHTTAPHVRHADPDVNTADTNAVNAGNAVNHDNNADPNQTHLESTHLESTHPRSSPNTEQSEPSGSNQINVKTPELNDLAGAAIDNIGEQRALKDGISNGSSSETPQTNDRNHDRLRDRTQSTGQKSQAPSTTSKRAAAMAAAELEDDVLVGTRVSEGHENFVTAYNMLTGIRVAVSRCTAKNNRPLTDADFTATDELSFHMNGGGHSPSSRYMFHFKDYSPWVFRHLRDAFGLDPADYLMSLTAKYIVSEMGSPGKSGSYFYYSRDFRFIIKTIRHSEHKLLRHILKQYYSHVKENPDTLISQIYGLHRVKVSPGRKIHFLVMNNVFPALYQIHERFDLKGSLLGREYTPDPRKRIVVYKDLDWLRQHQRIILGKEKRERLVRQLEIDTRFLERINVMDYSLLIGIHDQSKGNAALDALLKFAQFGPQDERQSQGEKRAASAAVRGTQGADTHSSTRNHTAEKEFAALQMLLQRATPERLKEFDFADEYRTHSYFYKEHGGFLSTDENNHELGVIYYIGVIDFLTGYTFRKSVETFCKSLIHDRRELSAVPAKEYGDRFLKFLRGSIGPAIPSTRPQKRVTTDLSYVGSIKQKVPNKQGNKPSTLHEVEKETDRATVHSSAATSTKTETPASSLRTPAPPTPQTPPNTNSPRRQNNLPRIVTTPVAEKSSNTLDQSHIRSSPGKAITTDETGSETAAASPMQASPESSKRRPSVVGYGLNTPIEA